MPQTNYRFEARGSFRQRRLRIHCLHRSIDAVVARDSVQVPLDHLRHGITMLAIELVQPVECDIEKVVVHSRMLGGGGSGNRDPRAHRRHQKKYKNQESHG